MVHCYLGPMVVISPTKGGSYIIAELDGSVYQKKIAQKRLVPYEQCQAIPLPKDIHELIDLSASVLDEMVKDEGDEPYDRQDSQFEGVCLKAMGESEGEDDPEVENLDSDSEKEFENYIPALRLDDDLRRELLVVDQISGSQLSISSMEVSSFHRLLVFSQC